MFHPPDGCSIQAMSCVLNRLTNNTLMQDAFMQALYLAQLPQPESNSLPVECRCPHSLLSYAINNARGVLLQVPCSCTYTGGLAHRFAQLCSQHRLSPFETQEKPMSRRRTSMSLQSSCKHHTSGPLSSQQLHRLHDIPVRPTSASHTVLKEILHQPRPGKKARQPESVQRDTAGCHQRRQHIARAPKP